MISNSLFNNPNKNTKGIEMTKENSIKWYITWQVISPFFSIVPSLIVAGILWKFDIYTNFLTTWFYTYIICTIALGFIIFLIQIVPSKMEQKKSAF